MDGVSGERPSFFPLEDKWVLTRLTQPLLDRSVLELFVNGGVTSVTRVEYPGEQNLGVSVFAEHGSVTLKSVDAWEMKPIW